MECLHGGESDKGLEKGVLKGLFIVTHQRACTPVGGGQRTYICTYIAGGEIIQGILAA